MRILGPLFFVGVVLSQLSGQAPKKPASLSDAIKAISPSVVQITYVMDQFPDETRRALNTPFFAGAAGTGFIVNDEGYVITALPVLSTFDNFPGFKAQGRIYPSGRNRLLIGLAMPNLESSHLTIRVSFTEVSFTVTDRDTIHDLALLRPDLPLFVVRPKNHVAVLSIGRPEDGEQVAVSGYPLAKTVLVSTSGAVASSWAYEYFQRPVPGSPGFWLPDTRDIFLVDLHVNHGNSGGPVYSVETSAVIGMCDA